MNKLLKAFPFLLYIAGLGALLLADIVVTKFLSDQLVAQWAVIRSFIGVSSVICLVGLDQVLVRTPESSFKILRLLGLQIPIISLLVTAAYRFYETETNSLYVFVVCAGTAGGLGLFQLYRSNGKRLASQWSQQSWKLFAGVYLAAAVLTNLNINLWRTVSICILVSFLSSLISIRSDFPKYSETPKSLGWIYALGCRSLVSSLLLALSIYAEQFVVGADAGASEAAYYFRHTTYFLLPASVLNGYLAFSVAPWLRENKEKYLYHRTQHGLRWLMAIVAYAIVLNIVGYFGWILLLGSERPPSMAIQATMLISSVARTAYTFPAGFAGAFGSASMLDGWIIFQTASFILAIVVYWLLSHIFQLEVILAVGIASATNWVGRSIVGFVLCDRLERSMVG